MNETDVSSLDRRPDLTSAEALQALTETLPDLTPELRKAAVFVLDNPNSVSVSSIREIAEAANVKPNTFMRMAKMAGYSGYDEFRAAFREDIRQGRASFPDRARFLQTLSEGGALDSLLADMAGSAIQNVEETFARIDVGMLKKAAEAVWASRRVYTLGVGVHSSNAANFTYLASTGMVDFHAIPKIGSTAADDLAWADKRDVLIAITCKPYRREVVDAAALAREQGMTVIGVSDSAASPVIIGADFGFQVATETPQFFPSSVSIIAFLETLLSFVIAVASSEIVTRVEKFHTRRHQLGLYVDTPETANE